jgi:hypothetical protein
MCWVVKKLSLHFFAKHIPQTLTNTYTLTSINTRTYPIPITTSDWVISRNWSSGSSQTPQCRRERYLPLKKSFLWETNMLNLEFDPLWAEGVNVIQNIQPQVSSQCCIFFKHSKSSQICRLTTKVAFHQKNPSLLVNSKMGLARSHHSA